MSQELTVSAVRERIRSCEAELSALRARRPPLWYWVGVVERKRTHLLVILTRLTASPRPA